MLTQEENQTAKEQNATFIAKCDAYKALLDSMELPLSIELDVLKRIFRLRLADSLLKADPGLIVRFEMLRTEAGRQKLREETAATIDLAGYEDVAQVESVLADLLRQRVERLPDQTLVEIGHLARYHNLDLAGYIDSLTMVWDEEKTAVLTYLESMSKQLQQLQVIMTAAGRHGYQPEHAVDSLLSYFSTRKLEEATIDTKKVYGYLIPALEKKGISLADFPAGIEQQ